MLPASSRSPRRARLMVESLESRDLLSATLPRLVIPAPTVIQTSPALLQPQVSVTPVATTSIPTNTSVAAPIATTLTFTATTSINTLTSGITLSVLTVTVNVTPTPTLGSPAANFVDTATHAPAATSVTSFTVVLRVVPVPIGPLLFGPILFLTPQGQTQPARTEAPVPPPAAVPPASIVGYFIAGDEETLKDLYRPRKPIAPPEQMEPIPRPRVEGPAYPVAPALPEPPPPLPLLLPPEAPRIDMPPAPPPPARVEPPSHSVALSSLVILLGCGAMQQLVWSERSRRSAAAPLQGK